MEQVLEQLDKIWRKAKKMHPCVHSLANFVTANDCANVILALGGSVTMADAVEEVREVTTVCDSLVLSMGVLHKSRLAAMIEAGEEANALGIPVILDPVGVSVSRFRRNAFLDLSKHVHFTVIRGNGSEVAYLGRYGCTGRGVDASAGDMATERNLEEKQKLVREVSGLWDTVAVQSGPIDLTADKNGVFVIKNGCEKMSSITGSGCMLSNSIGVFLAVEKSAAAAAAACGYFGAAGELALEKVQREGGGNASFRIFFIDYLSVLTAEDLKRRVKVEFYKG